MKKSITVVGFFLLMFFQIELLQAQTRPSMVMPVRGVCPPDGYFPTPIEGVCVHYSLLSPASTLKSDIKKFKSLGITPRIRKEKKNSRVTTLSRDKRRCEEYKRTLSRYETDGVDGVNLLGKLVKLKGDAKAQALRNAKRNVETFCD